MSQPNPWFDDMDDEPPRGRFTEWGLGVLVPGLLVCCFAYCLLVQDVDLIGGPRGRRVVNVRGLSAVLAGLVPLGLAIFFHAHFFWAHRPANLNVRVTAKLGGIVLMVVGLVGLFVRVGLLGRN